ncbi:MAG: hypothetical protein WCX30_03245 [Candidatus Paceibacterota bacterium]|jgi:hypothetical protein|nr:hypothetical protein [bacterium]
MEKEYKKLFTNMEDVEPSNKLFEKIMLRISREERMIVTKKRIAVFSVFLVISSGGFVYSFIATQNAFVSSGFVQFFSLIFSDFNIVVAYWQNFLFTLLESLPVFAVIISLVMFSIALGFLTFLIRDVKFINSNNIIRKKYGF